MVFVREVYYVGIHSDSFSPCTYLLRRKTPIQSEMFRLWSNGSFVQDLNLWTVHIYEVKKCRKEIKIKCYTDDNCETLSDLCSVSDKKVLLFTCHIRVFHLYILIFVEIVRCLGSHEYEKRWTWVRTTTCSSYRHVDHRRGWWEWHQNFGKCASEVPCVPGRARSTGSYLQTTVPVTSTALGAVAIGTSAGIHYFRSLVEAGSAEVVRVSYDFSIDVESSSDLEEDREEAVTVGLVEVVLGYVVSVDAEVDVSDQVRDDEVYVLVDSS
ncbi:hypothetical protein K501DRAFT_280611 [Backusella circina FSU 941]|nr:hypothetical protein K501DRAFT_280611 [Backusella circina FSU 941]